MGNEISQEGKKIRRKKVFVNLSKAEKLVPIFEYEKEEERILQFWQRPAVCNPLNNKNCFLFPKMSPKILPNPQVNTDF